MEVALQAQGPTAQHEYVRVSHGRRSANALSLKLPSQQLVQCSMANGPEGKSLVWDFLFFFGSCVLIMCELLLVFTFFPDYCCSHSSKAITEAQVRNVCLLLK